MIEIHRYADLLAFIDASAAAENSNPSDLSSDEDPEIQEWALLLSKASPGLMQKTRLRICSAGLAAVHRHITRHPHSD